VSKLETLIELFPGLDPAPRGTALAGGAEFERCTPSWDARGAVAADFGEAHVETVDGIPSLFIGRRTRNLLDPQFAPFADVPRAWRATEGVSLEGAGLSFGEGSLRVEATRGPACLPLCRP